MVSTLKHPKALPFLFLTELWERFGFYIAQGLLVLYMTEFYNFSDNESYTISGVFSGLVYIAPFVGGFLADRFIGFKTAIIWGGFFLVLGYALLSLSSSTSLFYPALATVIIGNGLLKPNISSLLGTQYETNDPKRDSGFTLFYIGINIGAALSGISGYVRNIFGWHVTFALASFGMIIGLIVFFSGLKYIKNPSYPNVTLTKPSFKLQLFFYCIMGIFLASILLRIQVLASWLLPSFGFLLLIFLFVLTLKQESHFRKRMIVLNTLVISSIIFWMLFLQIFNSANLYVERLVDKKLLGFTLSTTLFYASEGVFIILLGPLFAALWNRLGSLDKNPSPITKFIFGICFAGLGFLVLGLSTFFPNSINLINPLWIFFAYLLITIGELFLSPIGLSAVTSLAPPHLIGMMMGIWFVATGFGGLFAGWIAKLASVPKETLSISERLLIYQHAFLNYAYLAFAVSIILLLIRLSMKKLFTYERTNP